MRRVFSGKLRPSEKKLERPSDADSRNSRVGEQKTKINRDEPGRRTEQANSADKTNAAGPATRPHRSWIPACLVTAGRRNDRFSPATPAALSSEEAPPWPKRVAHSSSCDDKGATAAAASGPCFLLPASAPKSARTTSKRGRPQRPGNQSRSRAFLICPPAIHPRESPVAAGSAAIIRQAQELSRFAEPTLSHFVAPRNRKNFPPCAETVDDVSSLWKPEEN